MSLFKTKEWWQTRCGANETFDGHSLATAPLFGEERKDILIVGSQDGYLRMFCPSSEWVEETKSVTNYKSTDLILEIRVGDCIVDTKVGKFVSGSQDLHLAVMTSSKLIVYSALLTAGSTEYGDRCDLKIVYEHALPKFPASLTTGPFGGVRAREFFCVQCLDGTLLFYEQEVFAFSQVLGNRLLAAPIVYVSRYDLFVTASSCWFIECYRYQSMAECWRSKEQVDESNDDGPRANLEPDWSYNLGEAVLAIEAVTLTSFEVGIVVLGERHLYCFKDNCTTVKYAKRLEYRPVCCRAYVIEPDGKLMVMVIADTNTLLIYEGSTLKWSAQLPFPPVTVARVELQRAIIARHVAISGKGKAVCNDRPGECLSRPTVIDSHSIAQPLSFRPMEHLQGVMVVLSEDGQLEACYLGSEPSMFVAPPLHPRGYDYAAAERRLSELRTLLNRSKDVEDRTRDTVMETELTVSMSTSTELESPRVPAEVDRERSGRIGTNDDDDDDDEFRSPQPSCTVTVELSSYGSLNDVEVCVDVDGSLTATNTFYAIPTLCERHVTKIGVRVNGREHLPPISSDVRVTVSYRTAAGNLRALRRTAQLPLNAILRSCPPADNASTAFAAIIKSVDPLAGFGQLFPEFSAGQWQRQGWNAIGLKHVRSGRTVTVASGNAGNRYRVQASDGLFATLVVQRLADKFGDKSRGTVGANVGANHLQLVHQRLEARFAARREIERITNEIGLLTSQLSNIERRMLRTVRERAERSLSDTGLPFLFEATCSEIFSRLRKLGEARAERERLGHELRCSLRLLLLLLRLNLPGDKYAALRAAIDFDPRPSDRFDWEEIADATLATLLKATSRKSTIPETKASPGNALSPIASEKELGKLKKRLVHAIERLDGSKESDIAETEPNEDDGPPTA